MKTLEKIMRVIKFLLILILIHSCDSKESTKKNDPILFYFHTTTKNFNTYNSDTVTIDKIKQPDTEDTLLVQSTFKLNGERHWISLYTNYLHCGVDGGYFAYTLDTLGIIYMKSITWNSYGRLKCLNDSIDDLITVAIENIILNQKFHDIDLNKLYEDHRALVPPVVF